MAGGWRGGGGEAMAELGEHVLSHIPEGTAEQGAPRLSDRAVENGFHEALCGKTAP